MPRRRPQQPETTGSVSPFKTLPHNVEAELAVLSECLLVGEKLDRVAGILREEDFFLDRHRLIYRAALELRMSGSGVDVVTVGNRLQQSDQLASAGGSSYLVKIIGETPATVHLEEHAAILRGLARRRRLIVTMQRRAAEGYDAVPPEWETEAAREVNAAAELDGTDQNPILRAWRPTPLDMLKTPPAPRRWLLKHPTFRGRECPPGRGDGILPLGKTGVLSSRGGSGKTFVMIQLAVSVVTGMPWLGHFHVAHEALGGRVLLALAEETEEDYHHRIFPICEAMGLDDDQIHRVATRVQTLPLAGSHVSLLRRSTETSDLVETEAYFALRSQLRSQAFVHAPDCQRRSKNPECSPACVQGWSLVVIDPLARWGGPDVETDNAAATHFVETVESLIDVPGRPFVMLSHHSSKASRGTHGGAPGNDDARGVGGITDGLRWHGTLTPRKGGAYLAQHKSNCSVPWDEKLELVRVDGLLRVQSDEEAGAAEHAAEERKERRAAEREHLEEAAIARAERDCLAAIDRAHVPITTRADLVRSFKGGKATKEAAVTRLKNGGRILKTDQGFVTVKTSVSSTMGPRNGHGDDVPSEAQHELF